MAPGLWGAVLVNRRCYRVIEWYVNYLWVFGNKLWKSFLCTFLFLSEELLIKGPALELIYLFLELFATKMALRVTTSLKCLKFFQFFVVEIITVHTTMPVLWQNKFLWRYYPPCHFCGTENTSRIEKYMFSPQTSRSNCHFCGMVGNNVINQFCASFVAWWVTTFKKGAGWIGLKWGTILSGLLDLVRHVKLNFIYFVTTQVDFLLAISALMYVVHEQNISEPVHEELD